MVRLTDKQLDMGNPAKFNRRSGGGLGWRPGAPGTGRARWLRAPDSACEGVGVGCAPRARRPPLNDAAALLV